MTHIDLSHLEALELRLSHERARSANARNEKERQYREFSIKQIEKEVAGERAFLGLDQPVDVEMSDDELLDQLTGA